MYISIWSFTFSITLSLCLCSLEVTVTSLHPPRLCRIAVLSIKPTFLSRQIDGVADNPSLNGTLCHQDLDLALCHRAQAKVDKYQEGYAAPGLRHAFLPAIVSTSGRIHGELLRLLFNLADKKTSNSFEALGEAFDVDSEVYCRRRSANFWRM